jgi:hypothetical protein
MFAWLSELFGTTQPDPTDHQEDSTAPNPNDDPRGGMQSDDYRHADPREIVTEGSGAMTGPAGSPQDGSSADERREEQREPGKTYPPDKPELPSVGG